MNDPIPKKNAATRGRRVLDFLFSDGLWQVCLALVVMPVAIDTFLSMGVNI